MNSAKFLRTPFFIDQLRCLLLKKICCKESFAKLPRKHLRPVACNLIKRDSHKVIFLRILRNFSENIFYGAAMSDWFSSYKKTSVQFPEAATGGVLWKSVLKNFTNFTRKQLCWSLFFNNAADLRPEICEIFKNTYFEEHLRTNASELPGSLMMLRDSADKTKQDNRAHNLKSILIM